MKRVLLVDDDEDVLTVLEMVLRSAGYGVITARTAAAGRLHVEMHGCDLVVTDWKLRDGDGLAIAEAATARGARAIILSGFAEGLPEECHRRYIVLAKPFRPSELLLHVERLIGFGEGASD